jgi:hypothetical protein
MENNIPFIHYWSLQALGGTWFVLYILNDKNKQLMPQEAMSILNMCCVFFPFKYMILVDG